MPKITTEFIKSQIPEWLGSPYSQRRLSYHYFTEDDDGHFYVQRVAVQLDLPKETSAKDVNAHILKLFADPKQWSRSSKGPCDTYLATDVVGWENKDRTEMLKGEGLIAKCVQRTFMPKHDVLADNFRLEVVTDPTDTEIIFWNVIVD